MWHHSYFIQVFNVNVSLKYPVMEIHIFSWNAFIYLRVIHCTRPYLASYLQVITGHSHYYQPVHFQFYSIMIPHIISMYMEIILVFFLKILNNNILYDDISLIVILRSRNYYWHIHRFRNLKQLCSISHASNVGTLCREPDHVHPI